MDGWELFIGILYCVIWIPLKYAGLGIWWLITIPKRRRERIIAEENERKRQDMKRRREEQIPLYLSLLASFDTLTLSKKQEVCKFLCNAEVALRDDYLAVVSDLITNGAFCQDKMDLLSEVYQSAESYFELPYKYVKLMQKIFSNESECTAEKYAWCRSFLQAGWFNETTLPVLYDFETRWILQQGCEPIDCSDPIVNRPCFMSEELRVVYQRQHQGERYFDFQNAVPTRCYLFADALEFIDEGHWSISLGAILEMRILASESILVITCRNRGGLYLYASAHILSQLKARINALIRCSNTPPQSSAPSCN